MTYPCPRGHQSTEPDYCSECGARIGGAPLIQTTQPVVSSAQTAITQGSSELCPDCATVRPAGARFCEVCRYDFQSRSSYNPQASMPVQLAASSVTDPVRPPPISFVLDVPAAMAPPPMPDASPTVAPSGVVPDSATPTAPPLSVTSVVRLQLRIVTDPSLDTEPDPATPCPVGQPDRIFHLDLDENVLGRQYEGLGTHPEIVVGDPSISRRHLKFLRDVSGQFTVLELGSANGTEFNGAELEPGVLTPIKAGDAFVLGAWTRIKVEAR